MTRIYSRDELCRRLDSLTPKAILVLKFCFLCSSYVLKEELLGVFVTKAEEYVIIRLTTHEDSPKLCDNNGNLLLGNFCLFALWLS